MRILCVLLIFWGACIILYSIIDYYRDCEFVRDKTSSNRLFPTKLSIATFFTMIALLLGFLIIDIVYLFRPLSSEVLFTAILFFVISVFTFLMVLQERNKSRTIFERTDEVVRMLINMMEAKNPYMSGHSLQVFHITRIFYAYLPREYRAQINRTLLLDGALLHDIGKIGISDHILNKQGPLTMSEWEIMRQYPAMGAEILKGTSYESVSSIIRLHHERMDGQGYYGVPGREIPPESRMIMIADTFSALYNNRSFRGAQTFENAMRIIRESAGRQFDVDLVEVFMTIPREALDAAVQGGGASA